MKSSLQAGLKFEKQFPVPTTKTVANLYPESPEFQEMPEVFATGFMVGLIEWACLCAMIPHLDWPREQSVGTHVNLSHLAATPPGMTVTVTGRITAVEGKKVVFEVQAHDGQDLISEGSHERFIIHAGRFNEKIAEKAVLGE